MLRSFKNGVGLAIEQQIGMPLAENVYRRTWQRLNSGVEWFMVTQRKQ